MKRKLQALLCGVRAGQIDPVLHNEIRRQANIALGIDLLPVSRCKKVSPIKPKVMKKRSAQNCAERNPGGGK